MRKHIIVALLLAVAFTLPLFAAPVGSVTVTTTQYAGLRSANYVRYAVAWTSSAGGVVSGSPFTPMKGKLISVKFVPASGGDAPTDLYDVKLNDANGIDLLNGTGTDLSNTLGKYTSYLPPLYLDGTSTLDLVVANGGNAKKGTVYVWIEQ